MRYLSICLSLALVFISSEALDTLSVNQSMSDGKTLVSSGGSFELGFFSPGNSTNRYVGIWYKTITNRTVVWVANRDAPINDSYGVLKVDPRGIIVVLDGNGSVKWNSNATGIVQSPVAQLLDSGNFVVRNENDNAPEDFLWQSFDNPSDSLLPGMKHGLVGGLYLYLTAWKSRDDPATSDYTFKVQTKGLETIIYQGSSIVCRSGPWNGIRFSGVPYLKANSIFNYSMVVDQNDRYYTYDLLNSSNVISRLVLNPNGEMDRVNWADSPNSWVVYLAAPIDHCDSYALCGAYGSCNIADSSRCRCLDGFEPKYQVNWEQSDWSEGCVRTNSLDYLDCRKDGFMKYPNLKLPDTQNVTVNASMTLEECRVMCLNNCSCMAYANIYITNGGTGCFIWSGDLLDLRQFSDNGQDLYVRMAASEVAAPTQQKTRTRIILVSVLSAVAILFIVGLILFVQKKKRLQQLQQPQQPLSFTGSEEQLLQFNLDKIAFATNNFSFNNLIGKGGFGPVYKGVFKDGEQVAVKRLSKESRQGDDEFKNEVKVIAKLQHRNLVKLLGYCIQMDERMLIYEYMPNKSLDYYIFDQTRSKLLDWPMRFQIINGIVRGLLYLHQDSRLRIIHRDLKLSNILLDHDMNPKISDFGLARSFLGNETATNTKRVIGTYGYMSPEYAIDGVFSTKSDVFSFGVMVLEIVSGRRNQGFVDPNHHHNLIGHAWRLFNGGSPLELIDASILELCNISEVLRSVQIGLLCVQNSPNDRPNMSTVVLMLSSEGILLQPNEPGFFTERKLIGMESSSINDVTITTIGVR